MTEAGIYIHIPFCKRKCNYCDFFSLSNCDELILPYINAVKSELEFKADKNITVKTVYFGGGTPSLLPSGAVSEILNTVRNNYYCNLSEVTIECNPESLNEEILKEYKESGVNRISIGVQSLDDETLKILGRLHNSAEAVNAVKLAVKYFENVSADLMLGLPGQTAESLTADINTLIALGIKHLSCYALKVEEGTALKKAVENKEISLPDDDKAADLYDAALYFSNGKGFLRYEVSNFAQKGYESKHNLSYWRRTDYLGIGAAAHSFYKSERFNNICDVKKYIESIEKGIIPSVVYEKVEGEEAEFEYIMLALRTAEGIDISDFNKKFKSDFLVKYDAEIRKLEDFCTLENNYYFIKYDKFYVLNMILGYFLR